MTALLQCQEDANRFASTADQTEAYERHLGVRASVALLIFGDRSAAYDVLARSVERQARIQGIARVDLGHHREAS
jgi:hypothetical protein